jgi:hypothetical protein
LDKTLITFQILPPFTFSCLFVFFCAFAYKSSHSPSIAYTMQPTLAVHRSELTAVDKHTSLSATLHCPGLAVVDILTDTTLICDASIQIELSPVKKASHGVQVNFRAIVNALAPALVQNQPCRVVCSAGTQATLFPSEFYTTSSFFSDAGSTQPAMTFPKVHRQRGAIKLLVASSNVANSKDENSNAENSNGANFNGANFNGANSNGSNYNGSNSNGANSNVDNSNGANSNGANSNVDNSNVANSDVANFNSNQDIPTSSPVLESPPASQENAADVAVSSTNSAVQQQQVQHDELLAASSSEQVVPADALLSQDEAQGVPHEVLSSVAAASFVQRSQDDPKISSGEFIINTEMAAAAIDDNMLVLEMQRKERMVSDLLNVNNSENNSNAAFPAACLTAPVGLAQNPYQDLYNCSNFAELVAQASGACISAVDTNFTSVTSGSRSDVSSASIHSTPSSAVSMNSAYAMMPWCQLCNQYGHILDVELTHGVLYAKSNTAYVHGSFCEMCGAISHRTEDHSRMDTRRQKICTRAYNSTCAYNPCKFSHSQEEMMYLRNHPVIDAATPRCFKVVPFGGHCISLDAKLLLGCFKAGVSYDMCCRMK